MITIFFRYDDYSSLSHREVDCRLIEILERQRVPCTFAVVPAVTVNYPAVQGEDERELPLDEAKVKELKAAVGGGFVDVALHGWRHLANKYHGHPEPSEFKGLEAGVQEKILQNGSDFLFASVGVRPSVFVPPWNTYDLNTLRALEAAGFRGISANRYSPFPSSASRLAFAPITTEIPGLRGAVEQARVVQDSDPVIGVMMHPYDFHESADARSVISLDGFESELAWLSGSADIRVVSLSTLVTSASMDARRLIANGPSRLERMYPGFIRKVGADPVYRSVPLARRRGMAKMGAFAGYLLGVLLVGLFCGLLAAWLGGRLNWVLAGVVPVVAGLGIVFLALRAFRERALYARGATVIALLVGILIASLSGASG